MSLIDGTPGPTAIVLIIVLVSLSVVIRIYLWKRYKVARARCLKCGNVFAPPNTSGSFLTPYRTIKCPACGETSRMRLGTKEPITWPRDEPMKERSDENEVPGAPYPGVEI